MADAKVEYDWNHTSCVLAMINNVNVSKKGEILHPDVFHPFRRRPAARIQLDPKESVSFLSSILVPK